MYDISLAQWMVVVKVLCFAIALKQTEKSNGRHLCLCPHVHIFSLWHA